MVIITQVLFTVTSSYTMSESFAKPDLWLTGGGGGIRERGGEGGLERRVQKGTELPIYLIIPFNPCSEPFPT